MVKGGSKITKTCWKVIRRLEYSQKLQNTDTNLLLWSLKYGMGYQGRKALICTE